MASGSLGCASAISGRGTGLTPGLGLMPSTGANHGGKLKRTVTAAQVLDSALQVTAGETPASAREKVSCSVRLGRGGGKVQGSLGLKCRVRGRGLLVKAGAAQAGWLSGVRLKKSAGLGGRGEVQARGSRGRRLRQMRGGVIENGGGGLPFYRAFGQLKGPQAAEEPQGRKFRYYNKIYALHQHLSCKNKNKNKIIKIK